MLRLFVVVISSLLIVGDAKNSITKSKEEPKDMTIPCVFRNIRNCYDPIGSLGANLTIEFPRDDRALNETCKKTANFYTCTSRIDSTCGTTLGTAITTVQNEVREICKNGSAIQKSFLNATACFNKNVKEPRKCYFKYATNNTEDAKSLCCSVFKTKKCMRSLSEQCPKNATHLREELLKTYYGYADAMCGKYYKQCSAAVAIAPTSAWIVAALFLFISTIKIH